MPAAEAARPISPAAAHDIFAPWSFHAHVALAVSGGGDSTALMWLAARWRAAATRPPKISVLTVDHGLRPEAGAECAAVAGWAGALGLEAHILTWNGRPPASGLQARAREMRYSLLGDWCRKHGATLLATAHTVEDQAETVLMRLARGSGIRGLSGMRADETGTVLLDRPLLTASRGELRATLSAARHPWIDDPSNEDDRFERVRLRKAAPVLDRLGLTARAVARSAMRLERALLALESLAKAFMAGAVEVRPEGFAMVDMAAFGKLDREIAIQVLERLLESLGGGSAPPRLAAVEALEHWLRRGESRARTLAGCRIARRRHHILIGREAGRIDPEPVAITPGQSVLWDRRFTVSLAGADRPCAIVPVRVLDLARRGDIPAFVQESLPAVMDGRDIAAVPALGIVGKSMRPGLEVRADFHKNGL
ncbi:MAG: tRNA lysidine(34) synthetase TilS [Parvibaculaceae bacterium]